MTEFATISLMGAPKKIILSRRSLEYISYARSPYWVFSITVGMRFILCMLCFFFFARNFFLARGNLLGRGFFHCDFCSFRSPYVDFPSCEFRGKPHVLALSSNC